MINPSMRKVAKNLARQITGGVSQLQTLADDLAESLNALAEGRPPRIEELAMADVVGFFVENRKSVPDAEAAAILREQADSAGPTEPKSTEYLVHLFFLDKDGQPMIGAGKPKRSYLARQFDAELAGTFGENNIVIFN